MKIFYWNIRDISNKDSNLALINFCLTQRPDLVFITEPMVDKNQLPHWFWEGCGMKYVMANNTRGNLSNLWFCYREELDAVILSNTRQ